MGLAGGMVPSPSAVLVLLGAMALGKAWFGLVLVIAYGLGMAATLVGVGLFLVAAGDRVARRLDGAAPRRLLHLAGALPALSAAAVVVGGLVLAGRAAAG